VVIGFRAGEVCVIVDAPLGGEKMIGRIVEIAQSRVEFKPAEWRFDRSVKTKDMPMQFCVKPTTWEKLGWWPVAWMRPYNGERDVRHHEVEVIGDSTHKWLMLDPPDAVMR
jgi:hypothetical protein